MANEFKIKNGLLVSGSITGVTESLSDDSGKMASTGWIRSYLSTNGYLTSVTSSAVTTALGYTPVTNARSITINGTTYDLSADRSWTISASDSTKLPLSGGTLTGALSGTSATFSGTVVVASPFTIKASNPYLQWKNASDTRLGYIQHATDLVMAADSGNIVLNTTSGSFILASGGAATFGANVSASNFRVYNGSTTGGYLIPKAGWVGSGTDYSPSIAAETTYGINFFTNGSASVKMYLATTGQLQLNTYTSATSYTGTAAGYLAFDSSGNIITVAGVSGTDSTKLPLAGGTMTGALVVSAADRGFEVNTSGGISLYSNEINAGALGGTGTIYLGWRRTSQINVGVPISSSSTIAATGAVSTTVAASAWGFLATTSGYSNGSGIWFSTNVGELLLRKADGTLSTRISADGTNAFINNNNILHAGNYSSYALPLSGGSLSGPLTITGNGSYLGDWGYNTLVLNDTSGYPGIAFKNGSDVWLTRRSPSGTLDWAYSSNASSQGVGTFTQKMMLSSSEWWVSTYTGYKMRIIGGDVIESLNGSSATTLYLQYHSNTGGNVNIAASKFIFDNANNRLNFAKTSGTLIAHGSMTDAIGYNASYGTYIGSPVGGTYYLYANGTFNDNGTIRSLIHSGNIGSQSVSYATNANQAYSLPTSYAGGVQSNPQVYFNQSVGVKVAMTGSWSTWSDTLWINGYAGGDVLQMCALHTLRNGQPRMAISVQASNSTSYGSYYEFITTWNIASQTVGNTTSISSAVGSSYTWTGIQYFQTTNGYYSGSTDSARLQAYTVGANQSAFMSFHRSGYYAINMGLDGDNVFRIGGWSASANRFQMDMSGNLTMAGDVTAYSDARVKTDVETITGALNKVSQLRGVSYKRTDSDDTRTKIGVIAQETLPVVPEVVNQDNFGMYNVSYGNFAGLFIEAIKEQQAQITAQGAQITELMEIIKTLKGV